MTQRLESTPLAMAVLRTGLLAGLLDAIAATTQYLIKGGKSPERVWNYVASSLFGPTATTGGLPFAAVGLIMHFLIAIGWATLFYLVAVRVVAFRRHFIPVGLAYGLFVWVMMSQVLVPLTRIPRPKTFVPSQAAIAALIIMFCVGLPIAWRARKDLGVTA